MSKEFKIGLVVTSAIFMLYWGANFLNNNDVFSDSNSIYAKYKNIYKIIKNKIFTYKKISHAHFLINSFIVKRKKMKKNSKEEYLNREEVNEMIESALRRHNRRSTIISSVLGWILIGGYSFGLFQAVQNV